MCLGVSPRELFPFCLLYLKNYDWMYNRVYRHLMLTPCLPHIFPQSLSKVSLAYSLNFPPWLQRISIPILIEKIHPWLSGQFLRATVTLIFMFCVSLLICNGASHSYKIHMSWVKKIS